MARDVFGSKILLWDVLCVANANGKLEFALVTGMYMNDEYPYLIRFNKDGTLKKRQHIHIHQHQRFIVCLQSLPYEYHITRKAMIDAKG